MLMLIDAAATDYDVTTTTMEIAKSVKSEIVTIAFTLCRFAERLDTKSVLQIYEILVYSNLYGCPNSG